MNWLRVQIAVLAIVLIAASTQCLAQCVAQPCHAAVSADESVPPCHRHPAPKQTNSQESCKYLFLVSDYRAPSVASVDLQRFDVIVGLTDQPLALSLYGRRPVLQMFSPPSSVHNALFSVLRV